MKIEVAILLIFLAAELSGCGESKTANDRASADRTSRVTAPVLEAHVGEPVNTLIVGSIVSDHRVDASSRLSGYIKDIPVKEGETVKRGQLLAKLDGSSTEGGIIQSRAEVALAESAFNDASADLTHFQTLLKSKSVSENDYRKIKLKYATAQENLKQAQAALEMAESQRAYTEIKSPVDGTIISLLKHQGDMTLPGAPIMTVESAGNAVFQVYLTDAEVRKMKPGMTTEVIIDGIEDKRSGVVSSIIRSGDPMTRSYLVKITILNSADLMPGMFGRAIFSIEKCKNPIIPRESLVEKGGVPGIYIVNDHNQIRFRWVRAAREWPDKLEIVSGLDPGERYIGVATKSMRDGDTIAVAEEGVKQWRD